MEIMQLKYFKALALTENLQEAAEEMYVTASAISVSITKLENELEVSLFDRKGRNLRLNKYGRCLLGYVDMALSTLEEAAQACKALRTEENSTVTIAMVDPGFFMNMFTRFQNENPLITLVQVTLDAESSETINKSIGTDFIYSAVKLDDDSKWEGIMLYEDRPILAVPSGHWLANRTETSLHDLKEECFVLRPPKDNWQKFIDGILAKHDFTPKHQIECNYVVRPYLLRTNNRNVLFASLLVLRTPELNLYAQDTSVLYVKEFNNERYPLYFYWRKDQKMTPAMQVFYRFILDFADDIKAKLLHD